MLRSLGVALLAATLLGGCYLSHRLSDPVGAGGGREPDSGPRDGSVRRDGGGLPDASREPCRGRWEVTSELRLTDPPGDDRLTDVEWTGSGYLVGFHGPAPDSSAFAQLVTFEGEPAAPHRVIGPAPGAGWYLPFEIAVSGDGVAALDSSSRGCFFQPLARDGSPTSAARRIDARECRGLTGMRRGFYLLDNAYPPLDPEAGVRFRRLDVDGVESAPIPWLEIFGDHYRGHASVVLEDDSQLMLVVRDEGGDRRWTAAQRIDAEGRTAGPETSLPEIDPPFDVQGVASSDGVLIGWLHDEAGDPSSLERVIRCLRTTRDGRPLGEVFTLPGVRVSLRAGWSMTRLEGEIVVVYAELTGDGAGRESVLMAQSMDDLGVPHGGPRSLADAIGAEHVIARTNGSNVFVAYSAETTPSREVFALRLECEGAP